MGGAVAIEMANQLNAMGEEVAFVGILDTYIGCGKKLVQLDYTQTEDFYVHGLMQRLDQPQRVLDQKEVLVMQSNLNQALRYRFKGCSSPVAMFTVQVDVILENGNASAWAHLKGKNVTTYEVEGTHFSMLAMENNSVLVVYLNRFLKLLGSN